MHHFVVPPDARQGSTIVFLPGQAHQIARVLRLRPGDEVVVVDGQGAQYLVRLAIEKSTVTGEITRAATACHEPVRRVTLLVAPPRGERWDWLLQKGTELGVARFVPVVARYSQPGTTAVKPRHHEIVREATEQCRRLLVPPIDMPQPLSQVLCTPAQDAATVTILVWEGAGAGGPGLGAALRPGRARGTTNVRLVIGPEGGFHPDEIALARDRGIVVAGLGPLILRTETAALVAATIALYD